MEIRKTKGQWLISHHASELDDLVYYLYCKKKRSKYCQPQQVLIENKNTVYKGHYEKAKLIILNEKIKRVKDGI